MIYSHYFKLQINGSDQASAEDLFKTVLLATASLFCICAHRWLLGYNCPLSTHVRITYCLANGHSNMTSVLGAKKSATLPSVLLKQWGQWKQCWTYCPMFESPSRQAYFFYCYKHLKKDKAHIWGSQMKVLDFIFSCSTDHITQLTREALRSI